jgi:transcriptional regulator with XRE-family HTH domain
MSIDQTHVSKRLLLLMHKLNLNQKQLAAALQITQPAVSKYLNGRIPPAPVLLNLAKMSDLSMEWILTGGNDQAAMRVAEPKTEYQTSKRLSEKIERLPQEVQIQFENLINVLVLSL